MFNVIDSSDLDTMERKEIEQMVRCRMASLGLSSEDYSKFHVDLLSVRGLHVWITIRPFCFWYSGSLIESPS